MSKTDPASPPTGTGTKGANIVALPAKIAEPKPSEKVIAFVKRHPVLTVAGGVAVGVAVSALLPRRVSRRIVSRTLDLAEAAGAAGMVLGRKAGGTVGERAHDLGIDARKQASKIADRAEKAGDLAILNLEKIGLAAVASASTLGRATARRASRLGDAAADTANRLGDAAAARSTKVLHMAEDLKKRVRS